MNYQEMSESEINYSVARSSFKRENVKLTCRGKGDVIVLREIADGSPYTFDPCNSWADAGPIISSTRIGIEPGPEGVQWAAQADDFEEYWVNKNPPCAVFIVFLMMKEAETG